MSEMNINVPENPFRAKLTWQWRCFIFAAHHYKMVPHAVLARAFKVDPQTIGKICRSNNGERYKAVWAESERLGVERMYEIYATPELIKQVEERALRKVIEVRTYEAPSGPGIYYIRNSSGTKTPVEIEPLENIDQEKAPSDQPGIYYRPKGAEFWCINEEFGRPFKDVAECLRFLAEFSFVVG